MANPRIDPLTYAVLLPTLYAAHTVADHVVQTDQQAATKATSWRGMAGHVGGYQLTQGIAVGAVLAASGLRPTWRGLLAGTLVSAASHAFLDRRWPVIELLKRTGSSRFARAQVHVAPVRVLPGGAARSEQWTTDQSVPLPLHGPYLADQALHHVCLAVAAALMAVRRG